MESLSYNKQELLLHILRQLSHSCHLILEWNEGITNVSQYTSTSEGMQKMAASCMLIESIGEGVKKIEKLVPGYLYKHFPDVPWKSIMGLRDHIAHGYFNLDAEIIFDTVTNEIEPLQRKFEKLLTLNDL